MPDRDQSVTVSAVAVGYARTIRYMAAMHYEPAETIGQESYNQADMVRMAESLYLVMAEGRGERESKLMTEERCEETPLEEHILRVKDEEEHRISREHFLAFSADRLAELWSEYRGRRVSVEELEEVFARSAEDPERQKLLEWALGDERELSEVLSRRRRG